MNHSTHPISSADISIFSVEISKFAILTNTDIDCIVLHNFLFILTFFESLKFVLINMVTIFMMSSKTATQGLLEIKLF